MGKCQADSMNSKRWESTVGGNPDGKIKINKEVNGVFDGKHEDSTKNLRGKCLETADPNRKHKIDFTVDNGHRYLGVFINDETIEGFRIEASDAEYVRDSPLNGDEDWVAVKVGST
jgi:hypothetical protein